MQSFCMRVPGTVRLWDVEVAMERGDDATSLSVQGGQKLVAVPKDSKGIKTGVTSIAWHPDGNTIMAGCNDGSLQLWELRWAAPPFLRRLGRLRVAW